MTIIESNNRHAETTRKALAYYKELSASLDGWDFVSESGDVKLYSKTVEDQALPIVRGDAILPTKDYTLAQVAAVATSPGCRKVCKFVFLFLYCVLSPPTSTHKGVKFAI